jgi:glycosyltransferase involved in cell wall biosynthesis
MAPAPRLSFVVPVYEEGENIGSLLDALGEATDLRAHELLVVYDRDSDSTLPVLDLLKPLYPTLRTVRNAYGGGARKALLTGFAQARGEGVCVVMADLSDDLALLPRMEALLAEGFDLICPSRYMPGGRQVGGPWLKGLLSRWAGVSLHFLAGLPTRDPTNNFKLYRTSMIRRVTVETEGGFEVALEATVKAWRAGYRVTELPAEWRDRTAGRSQFRLWRWLPRYLRWYLLALLPGRSRVRPAGE